MAGTLWLKLLSFPPSFLPALPCPPNSFYAPCAPPCPPTCSNIYAGELCEKPSGGCLEGCVCNEGFVLSDDQCVPLSQCGCQDKDGGYHKVSEGPSHLQGGRAPSEAK